MITTRSRFFSSRSGSAEMPSSTGISTSRMTTSGSARSSWSTASRPVRREATTSMPGSSWIHRETRPRTTTASSTTMTRIGDCVEAVGGGTAETATLMWTRTRRYTTKIRKAACLDQPDFLELGLDNFLVERLHDVLVRTGMQRARDVSDVVLGRAEHDLGLVAARQSPQRPQELVAVHLRHVPVEQNSVRQLALALAQRLFAVLRLGDRE